MIEDVRHNVPWPVDPAEYPLSGPSSGPVYCPLIDHDALILRIIDCAVGALTVAAFAGVTIGLISIIELVLGR